jgi:hypothetical protein
MDAFRTWTDANFDGMCWRDVHGLAIRESDAPSGELILDIDDILEWACKGNDENFRVAQVSLRFHDVNDLRISVTRETPAV